jgi:hypothetical protein
MYIIHQLRLSFRFLVVGLSLLGLMMILSGSLPTRVQAIPSAPLAPQLLYTASLSPGNYVFSSAAPTLADLNGDNRLDIVAATFNGYIFAINGSTGNVLWSRHVLNYGFSSPTCGTDIRINASPAVGMLRAPGSSTTILAVVVSVGDVFGINGNGGVVTFDKNGNWLWTKLAVDDGPGSPDGCTDGVHSSPTIADVDVDGRNEVIFGGFDRRLHVLNDEGSDIGPWPLPVDDTVWSSSAVGDIDGDGQNEIVFGTDQGQTDVPCPYPPDTPTNYCGGSLQVFHLNGQELPGFPFRSWQHIKSEPVLTDLNADGRLDIVFGTGTYYDTSGLTPNDSFQVYAVNYLGQNLPGWPVTLGGATDGEPAIADLNNDGNLEVVMGTGDYYCFQAVCGGLKHGEIGGLYAIYSDGNNHSGGPFMWHVQPQTSDPTHGNGAIRGPLIADVNNDGQLDVIYSLGWEVQVVNGLNGQYVVGGSLSNNMYTGSYSVLAPPAVGDLDNDGKLEVVAGTALNNQGTIGAVKVWRPGASSPAYPPRQPFPMFRANAKHTGVYVRPTLTGGPPSSVTVLHAPGRGPTYRYSYPINNPGTEPYRFSVSASNPAVSVQPSSVITVAAESTTYMTITVNLGSYNTPGIYDLGNVTTSATYGTGQAIPNSPRVVSVQARVVSHLHDSYLPTIVKNH